MSMRTRLLAYSVIVIDFAYRRQAVKQSEAKAIQSTVRIWNSPKEGRERKRKLVERSVVHHI